MSFFPDGPRGWSSVSGPLETEMSGRVLLIWAASLLTVLSLTTSGCNVVRITLNVPLTQDDVAFIIPGQTSLTDVIAKLGAPDSLADSSTGMVATYRFLDARYSRVNFGWVFRLWSPVDPDMVISRTGLGTDAFQVHTDSDGIVTEQSFVRRVTDPRFSPYPFSDQP